MAVPPMHRVRARPERFTFPASVGRIPGRFAVDDIRGDRQDALCMHRIPVGGMLADLSHETRDDVGGYLVNAVVIIAELRNSGIAFILIVDGKSGLITRHPDLSVLDCGKTIG